MHGESKCHCIWHMYTRQRLNAGFWHLARATRKLEYRLEHEHTVSVIAVCIYTCRLQLCLTHRLCMRSRWKGNGRRRWSGMTTSMRQRLSLKAPWVTSQDSNHSVDIKCTTAQKTHIQLFAVILTLNTSELIFGPHGEVQQRVMCHGYSKPHKDRIEHRSHHSRL